LIITLAAVVAYSWYITRQISGLRLLQTDLADRNRKDSLQLLRIQNDLNSLGLACSDGYNRPPDPNTGNDGDATFPRHIVRRQRPPATPAVVRLTAAEAAIVPLSVTDRRSGRRQR
jgi:hypothetical protein